MVSTLMRLMSVRRIWRSRTASRGDMMDGGREAVLGLWIRDLGTGGEY